MRDLEKLYQELQEIEEELKWFRKKSFNIYISEMRNLLRRKRNIYININQIKQKRRGAKNE